jgi:hypothetical protein
VPVNQGIVSLLVALSASFGLLSCHRSKPISEQKAQHSPQQRGSLTDHSPGDSVCSYSDQPLRVSRDSIGPLPVRDALVVLRALCPAARDTLEYGEESAYPAIRFPFVGVDVTGWQYSGNLQPDRPAQVWSVMGSNARLPNGVSLDATWSEISKAYGRGAGTASTRVTVWFCELPQFRFELDTDPDRVQRIWQGDFSQVPPDTRVRRVSILMTPVRDC